MLATSPPMIFKNDFSKQVLVMARHLATREFWIHIYQRESVWIGPPPRHQRFFKNDLWLFDSYGSTRACFDMLATSPPELFEMILFQEKLFGYACNLDTNDFEELSLKVYILSGCGPCHQSLTKSIGRQISEVKLKGIGSLIVRHLFCLKPANHICCEFFGFRYTRYAPNQSPVISGFATLWSTFWYFSTAYSYQILIIPTSRYGLIHISVYVKLVAWVINPPWTSNIGLTYFI